MNTIISGDQYKILDGKLLEIKRQMRQIGGYPYDPLDLSVFLQRAIEGKFGNECLPNSSKEEEPGRLLSS
jgi:hypothetical protein